MEFLFDNSRDWYRLVVLFATTLCAFGLVYRRFNPPNDDWNPKTKDYWFALLMFAITGMAATLESLVNNEGHEARLTLTFVASLVCMNGLRRGGRWRGDGYADDAAADDPAVSPS